MKNEKQFDRKLSIWELLKKRDKQVRQIYAWHEGVDIYETEEHIRQYYKENNTNLK